MRIVLFISLLTFWSKEVYSGAFTDHGIEAILISQQANEQRSIADLWNSVKQSAINTWESVKNIAKHTGERIKVWIQNVKTKANDLNKDFKSRLQKMKEEISNLISRIKVSGQRIKQCIKKQQQTIDEILKEILKSVATCLSQSIRYLPILEETSTQLLFDKDEFLTNVENALQTCLSHEDIEECFNGVRKNVYNDLESEEKDVLKYRDETRAIADEVLNKIVSCTSNGLIEASAAITNTTIQIIKCVSKEELTNN